MLTLLKVVALFGALSVVFTQAPAPVHQCYTPQSASLEIGQCELAVLQFTHNPQGGLIKTGSTTQTKACGNCQVTLATLDGHETVAISLLNSLDAVRSAFTLCRGYGTVVVESGERQSSTNLTLGLGNAGRCQLY
ncbi:uncharacterized protein MELLADRAFT_93569 [Melampsora larici-populina 98AG31]|uniref:Secreted protein n=1 Tax=Melampsora larici-populina (strain 98AG31 / pathotype 3-4-7) TaxID=747676 RepID=F4RAW2_MELLP|nr:uncharacterized protein MELLADRAFT_93569 [Melampsora larici-populina 98AG31]EGG10706.1 secreted protein [Melampsora larici-populina 98AG31]